MISVIMPTYNREKTIQRAIDSVLGQTYQDLELIIVDDGSTDQTEALVKAVTDERVYYVKQENAGACAARNRGIMLAKGEYIAFQDSDDSWREEKLDYQLKTLLEKKADIVFCKLQRHGYGSFDGTEHPILSEGFVEEEKLVERSLVSTQTILCKAEILKENLFDVDMPRFQDFELTMRLAQKYNFYFCDTVLADLYLQDDSISTNKAKTIKAHERIIGKHEDLWEKYPAIKAWHYNAIGMEKIKLGEYDAEVFKLAFQATHKRNYFIKYMLVKCRLGKMLGRGK